MFKQHRSHQQPGLYTSVSTMSEPVRARLEQSWASVFYKYCFCQINEELFAVLYADVPSRPNVPVNVLVGLEILKSGLGWSDEELYDAFLYDVQVRYALGYHDLDDGHFALRSLYHFRQRLSAYHQKHGINLLDVAFEAFTDAQVKQLKVRTTTLRMDSTQIGSNIRDASRLYLVVEGVRRLWRILDETEQSRYADGCAAYLGAEAEHYVYGVKGKPATDAALAAVGKVLAQLLGELHARYAEHVVYQTVQRLFADNYRLEADGGVVVKANDALGAGALQSLDDLEATFRTKANVGYKGYVANVTETCHAENELQLLVKVQVEPNRKDDAKLLVDALPNLAKRTAVATLYTDGGFGSDQADVVLNAHHVSQIQTGIRGTLPNPNKLGLADFVIEQDAQGQPTQLTCPQGQQAAVAPGGASGFVARFDPAGCTPCPLYQAGRCRVKFGKRDRSFKLRFTQEDVFRAQRRRRYQAFQAEAGNLRAAVEATVRCLKLPFANDKVPVRGHFRVASMLIAAAAMCNVRRIQHYLVKKDPTAPFFRRRRHFAPLSTLLYRRVPPATRFPIMLNQLAWRQPCHSHISVRSC